jgi:hypothetical protein
MYEEITSNEEQSDGSDTSSASLEVYRTTIREQRDFEDVSAQVRSVIMRLQSEEELPSIPMKDEDRKNLVEKFILALDRGMCLDAERSRRDWILRNARMIYMNGEHRHLI